MKRFLLVLACASGIFAQAPSVPDTTTVKDTRTAVNTALASLFNGKSQRFLGTTAPGSITGNLPGDLYFDTTAHKAYRCDAPSGTAAPACTSVTVGGWTEFGGGSGGGGVVNTPLTCSTTAAVPQPTAYYTALQAITLSGNCTVSFTQPATGFATLRLAITQGASAYTVTWTSVKWPSGIPPVMTATASAVDWYSCMLDGTNTYCTVGQDFK